MAQSNCGRDGRMAPPGSNKRMGAKAGFVPRFCHHDTRGPPSIFPAQKTGTIADFPIRHRGGAYVHNYRCWPTAAQLQRVAIEGYPGGNLRSMAAVPEHMTVKIGDLVEVNTRYRDPSLPCNFVPWIIDRPVDANLIPAPAPSRSPQPLELTRFVAAGQKLRVEFLVAIEPDC